MNRIEAKITQIQSQGHLSLVSLQVAQVPLQVLVTDVPSSAQYLTMGNRIEVLLKETAIGLSKHSLKHQVSIVNQIPCTIEHIETGEILSKIRVVFGEHALQIIVTTLACTQMQLEVGQSVVALIKANEIMCNP